MAGEHSDPSSPRTVRFVFHQRLAEILGETSVTGVRLTSARSVGDDDRSPAVADTVLDCGLVVEAVGFQAAPIDGLPFDEATGTIPNVHGRVEETATGSAGVYVAGWIKRGPSGGIGQNKRCAQETVTTLLTDHAAGLLPDPSEHDIAGERLGQRFV